MTPTNDNAFMKSLLATFRAEAEEHLQAIAEGLARLAQLPPPAARTDLVERIYRDTHSLKGAARAVGMGAVEAICQALEDVFATVKRASAPVPDGLHRGVLTVLEEVRHLIQGSKDGRAKHFADHRRPEGGSVPCRTGRAGSVLRGASYSPVANRRIDGTHSRSRASGSSGRDGGDRCDH